MSGGFWESVGTAASVDWCEPNYVYTLFVAEFWNTLSSLPIALAGFAAVWLAVRARRQDAVVDSRYIWLALSLGAVGIGSAAFHGTLLKYPQASDELPMVYTGLVYLYIIRFVRGAKPGSISKEELATMARWRFGLWSYGLIFTALYFLLPFYFQFFIASYAAIVAFICIWTLRTAIKTYPTPLMRKLLGVSVGFYVSGFVFFWLPEHVLLACEHPLQGAQLHSLFHLTSTVGSYAWFLFALCARYHALNEEPEIRGALPFPYTA